MHFISTAPWLWRHIDHMTIIDKQRIAAVRTLEARGYVFNDLATFEADALHALLVLRADELVGCTEGSPEEAELKASLTPSRATKPFAGRTTRCQAGKGDFS